MAVSSGLYLSRQGPRSNRHPARRAVTPTGRVAGRPDSLVPITQSSMRERAGSSAVE